MCDFATSLNTTGMGNVSFPTSDNSEVGSEPIGMVCHKKRKKKRMKSLKDVIKESSIESNDEMISEKLTRTQAKLLGYILVKMLKDSKLNKNQLVQMFTNIEDMDIIADIVEYISDFDKKFSLPYISSKDEFLDKDKHESIIDKLAQYFEKYITVSK